MNLDMWTRGRSPDEKIKGHSGAIYRVPLMKLYTKYESSVVFEFLKVAF